METENLPSADASPDAEATSGSAPPDAELSSSLTESTDALTSAEANPSTASLDAGPFAPVHDMADTTANTRPLEADPFAPVHEMTEKKIQQVLMQPPEAGPSVPANETSEAAAEDDEEALEERVPGRAWTRFLPTVLVGILMFVLGGVGGFVGRPYVMPPPPTPTPVAAPQQQPADIQSILALLISKTRHFKGSPNAPVTMLEFADFQ